MWSDSDYYEKVQDMCCQLTLTDGKSAVKIDVPDKKFQYVFSCGNDCPKQHKIMCEDWEMGMLYLNSIKRHKDREKAAHIVRDKFLNEIPRLKYVYFMVGTHNRYPNTWLIISVLYPRKAEIQEIETPEIFKFL